MKRVEKGVMLSEEEYDALVKDAKRGRSRAKPKKRRFKIKTITAFLFVTTQIAALVWVSLSYIIAAYSTMKLGQPFPVEELSSQAIISLLGVSALKVIENIFEHNDGKFFGTCNGSARSDDESGG